MWLVPSIFTLARALPVAEIVVVDSSIEMIERAAAARDATEACVRERVSIVKGDMRDWPGSVEPFDAVVIGCCSVSHLLTLDDRRRTWATAFRLLRPGGVFILDVRVPDLATWPRLNASAHAPLWTWTSMPYAAAWGRGATAAMHATTYEPHLQRADVRLLYDRFDERALAERLVADFASHVYFPAELELLFVSADSRSRSSTATTGSCPATARRNMSSP